MTGLLARAGQLFVAPAAPQAATFAPPRPPVALTGVLAAEADLLVAAGAAAAALRREAGARAALVCVWRGHDEPQLPAPAPRAPGAARIAAKLTRRGLPARASGAVCVVELPSDPGEAVAAFRDALAAADAPAVLAVARRSTVFDRLLATADRLILVVGDPLLAGLAEEGLARLGPPVERLALPRALVARHAARLGLAATGGPEPAREAA